MIKADVYYRAESDQIILVVPVYVIQEETSIVDDSFEIKTNNYAPIGYAVDNNEILFILAMEGLKHFEYLGKL